MKYGQSFEKLMAEAALPFPKGIVTHMDYSTYISVPELCIQPAGQQAEIYRSKQIKA